MIMLNDIAVREAFHVALLRRLAPTGGIPRWRLKGGVNLRLFFGSPRYSEDMDLDADLNARLTLRRELIKHLGDSYFRRSLATLGIRDVLTDRTAAKDTETTLRSKLRLVAQGGVPLPTKVEISFRDPRAGDEAVADPVPDAIALRYLEADDLPLVVPHYPRTAALRQKIAALALRTAVQSRDIFDLAILTQQTLIGIDLLWLRARLDDGLLTEAYTRALAVPEIAFRGEVLEFIDEPARERYATRWEELQLFVADLISAIRETSDARAR
ncbi:MAG TPA: nucleotidyl transferase AbiEii/AbiGii toxin family protein [Gemmatimonadaceae bacterium]|nr:nucleotidyl transferase AbiEii/AbiGii toxin family protein [Gemmatimonadaceae bacterium]